jgi:hypothetical protein
VTSPGAFGIRTPLVVSHFNLAPRFLAPVARIYRVTAGGYAVMIFSRHPLMVGIAFVRLITFGMGGSSGVASPGAVSDDPAVAKRPERASHAASEVTTGLPVTVVVYNAVNLRVDILSPAERKAERIFGYAGIQLQWAPGLMGADVRDKTPSQIWNPAALRLRIWARAAAGKQPSSADTLGFCLSLEHGEAVVLADAIQEHVVLDSPGFADLLVSRWHTS